LQRCLQQARKAIVRNITAMKVKVIGSKAMSVKVMGSEALTR
jgi:hypothetical protein